MRRTSWIADTSTYSLRDARLAQPGTWDNVLLTGLKILEYVTAWC